MKIQALILFYILSVVPTFGIPKIIGGSAPDLENPGSFNTVALVKESGKIFCTGSVVAPNLIVTAKHCLMDKEGMKLRLYFGENTDEANPDLYRNVVDYLVRHPVDWTMTFPSFDVAWVKFEGGLPDNFRPLPILANPNSLVRGQSITQVGYGDHNPSVGRVDAGIKLSGKTVLHDYINNPRFFHILLFHGEEGQGSCHGDSGGPAYINLEGEWYIIGVTNGFDLVLTPESMSRTSDPDFPFHVDCSKNQSLYSFLGAHGDWIERTSGIDIEKSDNFVPLDRAENYLPSNLKEWCEATDIGSPRWNLLKILMDKKVDQLPQEEARQFYEDCDQVASYLASLDEIYLDAEDIMEGRISFETLKLLPKLKSVQLLNFEEDAIDLRSLRGLSLEKLSLNNMKIKDLRFLQRNFIKELSLEQNPVYSLSGIENISGLESLNVSGTPLRSFTALKNFNLKSLKAVGINSSVIFGAEEIPKTLERLDLRNSVITNNRILGQFPNLKEIHLTGEMGNVDLSNLNKLEIIEVKDFTEDTITWPTDLSNLKELSASSCALENIEFLASAHSIQKLNLTFNRVRDLMVFSSSHFDHLRELNLSANPILNVVPLSNLPRLDILRLFRTPLQTGIVPKDETNCPKAYGPPALRKFCVE